MRLLVLVLTAIVLLISCADHNITDPRLDSGARVRFSFDVPRATSFEIVIRTMTGYEVWRTSGMAEAGTTEVRWDGRASNGDPVKEGVYRAQLRAGDFIDVTKLLNISPDRDIIHWGTS